MVDVCIAVDFPVSRTQLDRMAVRPGFVYLVGKVRSVIAVKHCQNPPLFSASIHYGPNVRSTPLLTSQLSDFPREHQLSVKHKKHLLSERHAATKRKAPSRMWRRQSRPVRVNGLIFRRTSLAVSVNSPNIFAITDPAGK